MVWLLMTSLATTPANDTRAGATVQVGSMRQQTESSKLSTAAIFQGMHAWQKGYSAATHQPGAGAARPPCPKAGAGAKRRCSHCYRQLLVPPCARHSLRRPWATCRPGESCESRGCAVLLGSRAASLQARCKQTGRQTTAAVSQQTCQPQPGQPLQLPSPIQVFSSFEYATTRPSLTQAVSAAAASDRPRCSCCRWAAGGWQGGVWAFAVPQAHQAQQPLSPGEAALCCC